MKVGGRARKRGKERRGDIVESKRKKNKSNLCHGRCRGISCQCTFLHMSMCTEVQK